MKVSIPRKDLLEALTVAARVAATTTTIPIIRSVLLEADNGRVQLSASDLTTSVQMTVSADVQVSGGIAVPAKEMQARINLLPEADVLLEVGASGTQLEVICRKSEYRVNGTLAENFMAMAEVGSLCSFALSQAQLREMVRQTAYAADEEETRAHLMGVCFIVEGSRLRMLATNTHRLGMSDTELEGLAGEGVAIVPAKTMGELSKMLGNDGECQVRFDGNQIMFQTERVSLSSRLIEGRFPIEYGKRADSFAPKWRILLNREDFRQALRRMRVEKETDKDGAFTKVVCHLSGDTLRMQSTGEIGRVDDEILVDGEGEEMTFGANAEYMLDALNAISSERVWLKVEHPLRPILIAPEEETRHLALVSPLNLSA